MQVIQLKQFGNVLISRPAGAEAFHAIRPQLNSEVPIEIDFDGVLTVTPSWLDEFLTKANEFNGGKVDLRPTKNASVLITLPVLAQARKDFVADTVFRAIERMRSDK